MASKNPPCHFQLESSLAYDQLPLKALPEKAREVLCTALNKFSILSTTNGIDRNFEGLAELAGFLDYVDEFQSDSNPTEQLLKKWEETEDSSIGNLLDYLKEMERFDIIDDLLVELAVHLLQLVTYISPAEEPNEEQDEEGVLIDPKRFNLKMVSRSGWKSRIAKNVIRLMQSPVDIVFIHHSVFYMEDSVQAVQYLQAIQMIHYGYADLPYSFLISNDGTVFVGRGWDVKGAHTNGFNGKALSFALIGNYEEHKPPEQMFNSIQRLIEYGISINKISPEYGLYCHCDASDTASPGKYTKERLKHFPRYHALGDVLEFKDGRNFPDMMKNSNNKA